MRKIIYPLLSFTVCFSFYCSYSQDTTSLRRVPYKLHIDVDKKTFYEEDLPAREFVYPNNSVQLYPGETVYLEAEVVNGKISKLRAVPSIVDSSKTIVVSFTQTSKKKVHEMMMLKVENPFAAQLSYKAMIVTLNHKDWASTSILPIPGNLSGYETWSDIITSIALGDWKLE